MQKGVVQDPKIVCFWCSVGLFVGALSYLISTLGTFFWIPVVMPCHEIGHAIVGWLSGKPAIPTLFITVSAGDTTPLVHAAVSAILLLGLYLAFRARHTCACVAISLVCAAQVFLSVLASETVQKQIELIGGLGGECLLAPLLAWLAFVHLGSIWQRYRVGLATWSSIALGSKVIFWGAVVMGLDELPHGALLMGEEMGDTNRLIEEFHWTSQHLIWLFSAIALCSLWLLYAILTVEYLRFTTPEDPQQ